MFELFAFLFLWWAFATTCIEERGGLYSSNGKALGHIITYLDTYRVVRMNTNDLVGTAVYGLRFISRLMVFFLVYFFADFVIVMQTTCVGMNEGFVDSMLAIGM